MSEQPTTLKDRHPVNPHRFEGFNPDGLEQLSFAELEEMVINDARMTIEGGGNMARVADTVHRAKQEYDAERYNELIKDLDMKYYGMASLADKANNGDGAALVDVLLLCPDLMTALYPSRIRDQVNHSIKTAFERKRQGNRNVRSPFLDQVSLAMGYTNTQGRPRQDNVPDIVLRECKKAVEDLYKYIRFDGEGDKIARSQDTPEKGLELISRLRREARPGRAGPAEAARSRIAEAFKDRGVTQARMKHLKMK